MDQPAKAEYRGERIVRVLLMLSVVLIAATLFPSANVRQVTVTLRGALTAGLVLVGLLNQ